MNLDDEDLAVFRQSRTLNEGIMALIHKGIADAKPLCDSIKRAQKFTGQGLTPERKTK